MKLLNIAAAALVAITGLAAASPAAAQDRTVVRERVVTSTPTQRTRVVTGNHVRTTTTSYRDRGRHNGWRNRRHRVCTVRWHHGQRVRTCRYTRW